MKLTKYLMSFALASAGVATFTSCEDMLDKGNSYVIYADVEHLTSSSDTITSLVGILQKMQAIGVRTNLLGEVRADLVKVNDNAITDIKDLANFQADVLGDGQENKFNNPRDYYAVINNCNYFLEHVNDSLKEIHTPGLEYMFERETAVVRTLRAWTYLQCVLVYGKVPFVEKAVLSTADSKKTYPMYGIEEICDYFIKDLTPYADVEMPGFTNFGGAVTISPKLACFPTNLVLADLYLWKAASAHDKNAAKLAAKHYYDFIVWDKSGKVPTVTGSTAGRWSEAQLYKGIPQDRPNNSYSYETVTSSWGKKGQEVISTIIMDNETPYGVHNDLVTYYNATQNPELKEAQLSPSESLKELSAAQDFIAVYKSEDGSETVFKVVEKDLEDEAIEKNMLGDLRLSGVCSTRDMEYNEKEIKLQGVSKHGGVADEESTSNWPNIAVYRVQQIYLRLAEALNYAGYPRFAKQILTTGVNNSIIEKVVQPYYTTPEDSAFIGQFLFNDLQFMPAIKDYVISYDKDFHIIPEGIEPRFETSEQDVNMLGIHSRGSGVTYYNEDYLPFMLTQEDSLLDQYPVAEREAIPEAPVASLPDEPRKDFKDVKELSTWEKYGETLPTEEEYVALWKEKYPKTKENRVKDNYKKFVNNDSIGKYVEYLDKLEQFQNDYAAWEIEYNDSLNAYNERVEARQQYIDAYQVAWYKWNAQVYASPTLVEREQLQCDQAILDEQALEMAFEGNRYYDLMRRALWYNDAKKLNDPISKARPELSGKLLDKKNWFLHYKGQIGY